MFIKEVLTTIKEMEPKEAAEKFIEEINRYEMRDLKVGDLIENKAGDKKKVICIISTSEDPEDNLVGLSIFNDYKSLNNFYSYDELDGVFKKSE